MAKNNKRTKQKRQRGRKPAVERQIRSQFYRFTRTLNFDLNINPSTGFATAGNNLNLVFALQGVSYFINGTGVGLIAFPNYSEFTALFDQYMIESMEVELYWSKNSAAESGTNAVQPLIWSAYDYDDASNTSLSSLQQYPAIRSTALGEDGGKVLKMKISPVPRVQLPDGSGGTAYAPTLDRNPWIDCGYPAVEHLGVKTYLDTFGRTASLDIGTIKVVVRGHFAFKNVR